MPKVIGIDLGTTYSAAAFLDGSNPRIIPNAEGRRLTPSVVAFPNNGSIWVGQLAKRQAVANPEKTIASIKRRMGSEFTVNVDSKLYTPQEISSLILRKLKCDAEEYLGERIEKAVITVPAYFNDRQRQATKDAGTIAGLDVIRIINEPTAASLMYGLDKEDIHTILVWDLGGGTFDVSLLELGQGVFEVKAVNGNTQLGGDDFDHRIIDHVADEFLEKSGTDLRSNKVVLQRLREAAEKAKIELSDRPETHIRLPFIDMGQGRISNLETIITREKFDELTKDLIEMMIGPTRGVLHDAQLEPKDIDRVILVGGATRMVCVQNLVRDLIGKEPYRDINPDEVVALGAAIQAGILTGEVKELVLVDVTPLSLGIETQGGIFARIIERNTTIPTSAGQIFTTAADDQAQVDIHVLQGERGMAAHNMSLGRFQLTDIPPLARGEPKIEVEFNIDANGIVNVSAKDLHTGNRGNIVITSHGGLSDEEIEKMVEEARSHAGEDMEEKEAVEINIRADNMIYAAEKAIRDIAQKLPTDQSDAIEKGILDLKSALAGGDKGEVQSKTHELKGQIEALYR